MTATLVPNLTVLTAEDTNDDPSTSLVIDVPAKTSPEVWHLVERIGATLEELFAAVAHDRDTAAPAVAFVPQPAAGPATSAEPGAQGFADVPTSIDLQARRVRRESEEIHLTPLEFELLVYFVQNPLRAINRDELLNNVWRQPAQFGSRTIDVHVRRLRHKLGPDLRLTTVRGYGYRFDGAGRLRTA